MGEVFHAQLSSTKIHRAATSCEPCTEMGLGERLGQGEGGSGSSWVLPRRKAIGHPSCTQSTSHCRGCRQPGAITAAAWCPVGLVAGCSPKSGLLVWRQDTSHSDLRRKHGVEQEGKQDLRTWEKSKHGRWPKVELVHIGLAECRA